MELDDTDTYVQKLEDSGMEVNRISDDEISVFKKALEPMYEKYRAQFGDAVFAMAEKYE